MAKPPGVCIYCGGPGLTREHIWADWLKNYVPRDLAEHTDSDSIVYEVGVALTSVKKISGDPRSQKPRKVCKDCNSGWMSRLQEEVMPHALPLICGEACALNRKSQKLLSSWIGMSVVIGDAKKGDRSAIAQADRTWLYKKGALPAHWRIWIGHFPGSTKLNLWQHEIGEIVRDVSRDDNRPAVPNTQSTVFLVGKLFVYAVSSSVKGLTSQFRQTDSRLRQLWPMRSTPLIWHPPPALSESSLALFGSEFFSAAQIKPPIPK